MGIQKGDRVLDVGCGVGGPLRNIARFTGAKVVGLNNNEYQVRRANKLNAMFKVTDIAEVTHGDFMNMPFEEESFDHVYAIEATCHAPDRTGCYKQAFRCLKEGGVFAGYEWTMTDAYDPENAEHRKIKHGIEEGNSLPVLTHYSDIVAHLKAAGFEVIEAVDVALEEQVNGSASGWWESFKGGYTLSQWKHTRPGRFVTNKFCEILEFLKIAPKGTATTAHVLAATGDALCASGETGIFTPMFFFLARKPVKGENKSEGNKSSKKK
jgi:sterol 24-C-methyltransferase